MEQAFSFSFLAPIVFVGAATLAIAKPGKRPEMLPRLSEWAGIAAMVLVIGGLVQLVVNGPATFSPFDDAGVLAMKADPLSQTMALLVSFVGWIVLRYSRTYLDGEAREGVFHGLMLATLGAVLLFVHSASIWMLVITGIAIGLGLKRLLLFYPDRAEARRAATKFAIVWHSGDIALVLAALLLVSAYGTADLSALTVAVSETGLGIAAHIGVGCLVLAAILKTAAFPLHGWLTEVMEAPTPVSALLHAGIINAGGVILIGTAGLVQSSPGAMAALVTIGGFTALFGAAVMLTQSAIKTSLAWSTVSQMGFLLLQCGLGLWALALLHIVAHSLYKAHAFLSSGGAVAAVASIKRPGPVAIPGVGAVSKSFALALVLYAAMAVAFTVLLGPKTAQALALGAILIFGVAYLVAQGLADMAPTALTQRTVVASVATAFAYFSFQAAAEAIWGPALPTAPVAGPLEWALIVLAVTSFGLVALAQSLFPLWAYHPAAAGLRIHLANGLYVNALLDRALGGFRITKPN